MAGFSLSLVLAVVAFFSVRSVSDTKVHLLSRCFPVIPVWFLRPARGAATPVDDLGFVDVVARIVGGRQARGLADRAGDVGDSAAGAADGMVVVVADPQLVQAWLAGWLDAAYQTSVGEGAQHVVYRLRRAIAQVVAHRADEAVDGGVRRASGKGR